METLLLTVDEVAARLQLSASTVRKMIQRNQLPRFPLTSNVVRISRVALEQWVAERSGTAR